MDKEKTKQTIKLCVAVTIFAIVILLVVTAMIRYEVEGDKNMPFNLSKIIVIAGTNASGKSSLAIDLAKKYGGEIVS